MTVEDPLVVFAAVHNHIHRDKPLTCVPLIGRDCHIAPSAVIGGQGFRVFPGPGGRLIRLKHIGGVHIGHHVEIGANSCVDRGVFDNTFIDSGVMIDNLVQIGHGAQIGRNVEITASVTVGGSAVLHEGAFVGLGAVIRPSIVVGKGAFIGMGAVVVRDVPAGVVVAGNPARVQPWKTPQGSGRGH